MWPDLELIGLYPLRFSEIRARNYIPVPNTTSPVLKKGISDTEISTCLLAIIISRRRQLREENDTNITASASAATTDDSDTNATVETNFALRMPSVL